MSEALQERILAALAEMKPGDYCEALAIARSLGDVSSGDVAGCARELVRRGLVRRDRKLGGGGSYSYYITDAGRTHCNTEARDA